ncbi:Serine/Threonine-Protein Kinase 38-Like [Manis pentadactyla]|nr:Serine/Threonine-Protein Kinase 38-Like [Manis pentadactyla]
MPGIQQVLGLSQSRTCHGTLRARRPSPTTPPPPPEIVFFGFQETQLAVIAEAGSCLRPSGFGGHPTTPSYSWRHVDEQASCVAIPITSKEANVTSKDVPSKEGTWRPARQVGEGSRRGSLCRSAPGRF